MGDGADARTQRRTTLEHADEAETQAERCEGCLDLEKGVTVFTPTLRRGIDKHLGIASGLAVCSRFE
jgi:hypothetical protein